MSGKYVASSQNGMELVLFEHSAEVRKTLQKAEHSQEDPLWEIVVEPNCPGINIHRLLCGAVPLAMNWETRGMDFLSEETEREARQGLIPLAKRGF